MIDEKVLSSSASERGQPCSYQNSLMEQYALAEHNIETIRIVLCNAYTMILRIYEYKSGWYFNYFYQFWQHRIVFCSKHCLHKTLENKNICLSVTVVIMPSYAELQLIYDISAILIFHISVLITRLVWSS